MSIHVCAPNLYLQHLLTLIRDVSTERSDFRRSAELLGDYLLQQCVEFGLVAHSACSVHTPTGAELEGVRLTQVIAVPILRAGNAWANSVFRIFGNQVPLGQLVIQRDEKSATPCVLLAKLPTALCSVAPVLLLDPMLATGGSAIAAIRLLVSRGVDVARIVLVHAVASPEGLAAVQAAFPTIRGLVGVVDDHLNERKFIVPGLGDFGDRFYA